MKKKATLKKLGSDWTRLSSMENDEVDTSEIPEISPEQFAQAIVRRELKPAETKVQLTIRIDKDVLEWYRKRGRGYQARINSLLRAYMEAHRQEVA
jgi:uncharacterized protein (DUF4415 family)